MKNQKESQVFHGKDFFTQSSFPFHMDRYQIKKDSRIVSHTHDFFELVYVLKGNAVHQIEDQVYQLSAGNVFFLEPEVSHLYDAGSNQDTIVFNVLFTKEFLNEELKLLSSRPYFVNFFYLIPFLRKSSAFAPYLPLNSVQQMQISSHLEAIYQEYQKKEEGFQIIVKTRLMEILILLSRFYKAAKTDQVPGLSDGEMMDSIIGFLEKYSNQPVTLIQLSRFYGISVSSLTAKFKLHTGKTLVDYKQSLQISQACRELEHSQKKISAIALDCGFNDLSHFNRTFKKHTGCTPRNYRLKINDNEK